MTKDKIIFHNTPEKIPEMIDIQVSVLCGICWNEINPDISEQIIILICRYICYHNCLEREEYNIYSTQLQPPYFTSEGVRLSIDHNWFISTGSYVASCYICNYFGHGAKYVSTKKWDHEQNSYKTFIHLTYLYQTMDSIAEKIIRVE